MESVEFQATSERLDDGTMVVSVTVELDLYTVQELERVLPDAAGAGRVVVDLSQCTFLDSTALGVLVEASRRLDGGAPLLVVAASAEVLRPFELTGLDRKFAFHPSLVSRSTVTRR
jgi:anti-anti-sigma factor